MRGVDLIAELSNADWQVQLGIKPIPVIFPSTVWDFHCKLASSIVPAPSRLRDKENF